MEETNYIPGRMYDDDLNEHKIAMQGVIVMPQNPKQGSPPPNNTIVAEMENSPQPNQMTKETLIDQSHRSDSGIFSATANTTIDQSAACDSDVRSDCSSPERKYFCPICDKTLTSQHEFTLHIRSHNNENEIQDSEKGFSCRICKKVLSSSSSLDRHVLVHSGERPFHCKYCGDTFTTNGNMHRHMRTHSHKTESYESDGSTDSSSSKRSIEYNNNKVEIKPSNKRKCEELSEENNKRCEKYSEPAQAQQTFKCPVCERNDFTSILNLEIHLEDNHPEYPAKCNHCKQVFLNNKLLVAHKALFHENISTRHPVVGFKDLTFVDFSSEKFPHIAARECELNLHKVSSGLRFQCRKCSRAFPSSSSLEIHEKSCIECSNGLDLSKSNNISEAEIRRTEFFTRLNLQDNSPEKKPCIPSPVTDKPNQLKEQLAKVMDNTKDLADIQSILSNINLQQLQSKHNELRMIAPPKQQLDISTDSSKNEPEEESQDIFAVEFRKMKLRGEFPCRLCIAVFPNLRALKGHNRAHLNGNTNGTYYCNMCPHSSIDKAALIRHMRTHNGDRPYECSLCNYAFTTKANCERHLRNRHAKTTREEVKKSIIYHPSEDPTNDELNKLTGKEDVKKLNFSPSTTTDGDISPDKLHCSTPKLTELRSAIDIKNDINIIKPPATPMIPDLQALKPSATFFSSFTDVIRNENLRSLKEKKLINNEISSLLQYPYKYPQAMNSISSENLTNKIQVKNFESLKENHVSYESHSEDEYIEVEEEPLNLVLDLSKKKCDEPKKPRKEDELPQDLTKKSSPPPNHFPPRIPPNLSDIFTQTLLKSPPKIDPAALYATQLALYRSGFPGLPNWPAFPINPLFFNSMPPTTLPQNSQDIKERMQRFQLCGGSMIGENLQRNIQHQQSLHSPSAPFNGFKPEIPEMPKPEIKENKFMLPKKREEMKPLNLNIDSPNYGESVSKLQSPIPPPSKSDITYSPNSVKMVIKNGVLMPKQKQRRYRTERPFTCEHCSARFTLRSNMERHIKQQHPQFWSQRQRGNVGNPGRKPQGLPLKANFCDLSIPNYELPKIHEHSHAKDHLNEKLKFAILAQQLRANQNSAFNVKKEIEDEDCDLVIDENDSKCEIKTEDVSQRMEYERTRILEEKMKQLQTRHIRNIRNEEDLVPVSRLLDNASQQQFKEYFKRENEEPEVGGVSEEDEEGLVASGSTSEENVSGTDENRSESENTTAAAPVKKKSAYSLAPNRVSCSYCSRKFPWTSSLRRHILTHTGQKPYKCSHCPLLFTTKSNCDRHLLRKHGNSATTISTEVAANNNTANYLMRNVPERPFKCSNCPSSTFSTYSNLKKHISCKHSTNAQGDDIKAQGYEAGSSEDERVNLEFKNDWENQLSYTKLPTPGNTDNHTSPVANSDLPFKCHLCEGSFGERQEALEHIRDKHASEYDLLMSKNAFDSNATTPEEPSHHDDEDSEIRGKFPDYSNRKVICAWCMRRFWSAEDLRRHMRTHTGERPFSCDICRRKFTLKHSMLRHRKKHNVNFENDTNISDEDGNMYDKVLKNNNKSQKLGDKMDESDGNEGGDLISNLLGLRDRSIIDKVLDATADDAAKLLGVRNGIKE